MGQVKKNNSLIGQQFSDDISVILHQLEALEPQADQFKKQFLKYLVEMAQLEANRLITENQQQGPG